MKHSRPEHLHLNNLSIFQKELKDTFDVLKRLLEIIDNNNRNSLEEKHFHESIGIFGNRGIGKTSFILSLKSYLKEKQKEDFKEIYFLPTIDPSILEDSEYFLVTVISLIWRKNIGVRS